MKWWQKLNDWLDWRGIKWKDLIGGGLALGTILVLITMLTWAGLQ